MSYEDSYEPEGWDGPYGENILDHPMVGKAVRRLPGKYAGGDDWRAPEGSVGVIHSVSFNQNSDRFPYRVVWFLDQYETEYLNHEEFEVCDG